MNGEIAAAADDVEKEESLRAQGEPFAGLAVQGADGDPFAADRTGICTSAYFIQKGMNGEL